jgi:hypothetical protein
VLRRIFGTKGLEETDGWRKWGNEELHNLYRLSDINKMESRSMRWNGHMVHVGQKKNAYSILVGKHEDLI